MKRPVILHIMNNFCDGSISRIVYRLVRTIGCDQVQWHVAGVDGGGDMQDAYRGLGAEVVDFSAKGSEGVSAAIRSYLHTHRVTVVHSHTPRTLVAASRCLFRRPASNDHVTHIATKHILNAPGDRRWGTLYTLLDRFTLYLPDHLVAVSRKIYSEISATPGIPAKRVTLIPNAIDCDWYYQPELRDDCRAEFGLTADQVVIGTSGRLEQVKRYDLLLEGFAAIYPRHPNLRLMILGEGELRSTLVSLAEKLQVSHAVIFPGFRRDMPRLLSMMDMYIQSSINEGLSLSILEAMVAGKPVIITDVGGAREVVIHGETGLIVPPLSARAIADAIASLLETPEKKERLASAARAYVSREHSIEKMTNAYYDLYLGTGS